MKKYVLVTVQVGFLVAMLMVSGSFAFDCSDCSGKPGDICRQMNALDKKLKSGATKRTEKLKSDLDELVSPIATEERGKGHGACADSLESALSSITGKPADSKGEKSATSKGGKAGEIWREPVTGMEMVWVPGGCYEMGCGPWSSDCGGDEKPVHEVCVDGYWIGKYEVTQGEYARVMGSNPSEFNKGEGYPVENVSWEDAIQFIRKLSGMNNGKYEFRLPSEAEWEYACRSGGKPEKFAGGSYPDGVAWHGKNSGSSTHLVGTKEPNGLGIYDMSGNVWEWCQDIYSDKAYSSHQHSNPIYSSGGSNRVRRGGGWDYDPTSVGCAYRYYRDPASRYGYLGFRLVRSR